MAFRIETLTLENGARLGISPLPGRFGAGLADLSTIAKWAPDVVVSMTGIAEMERHNMSDLGGLLAQFGIDWQHFPIRDFGAPQGMANWPALSKKLHKVLDQGGAVLAHCYGGHGRSGMVLLRLMVERGMNARTALDQLRAVRPGAVETDAQFAWAAKKNFPENS
ncbi:MAG: protein phosphatase [Alphaproteobacteria bacterium]|nr:protein phosphatase [Alphaproteobacteria bacterium]